MARTTRTSTRPAARNTSSATGISISTPARSRHPRAAQPQTYPIDESSDEDEDEDDSTSEEEDDTSDFDSDNVFASNRGSPAPGPRTRRQNQNPRTTAATRALRNAIAGPKTSPTKTTSTQKTTDSPRRRGRPKTTRSAVPSPAKRQRVESPVIEKAPGIIPQWLTPAIPYRIWRDIFFYAAATDGNTGILNTSWLWRAATVCHAFKEPALSALYTDPLLKNANKARRFAATLMLDPSETIIDYRSKIITLHLDISIIPAALYFDLISPLPALQDVIIYTQLDQPPYRTLDRKVRWSYGKDIFNALESVPQEGGGDVENVPRRKPTILKSWEWSARLLDFPLAEIAQFHQRDTFSHLTKVGFINFQVPSLSMPPPDQGDEEMALQQFNADGAVIEPIANAICELKYLRHLTFESSTVMNHRMLPLLPHNLVQLDLINCWEVRSEDLSLFLNTHSQELKVLNLLSCQSLNLAFLTELAQSCPKAGKFEHELVILPSPRVS